MYILDSFVMSIEILNERTINIKTEWIRRRTMAQNAGLLTGHLNDIVRSDADWQRQLRQDFTKDCMVKSELDIRAVHNLRIFLYSTCLVDRHSNEVAKRLCIETETCYALKHRKAPVIQDENNKHMERTVKPWPHAIGLLEPRIATTLHRNKTISDKSSNYNSLVAHGENDISLF